MQDRNWWLATALSGAILVAAGAFAAHGLSGLLSPKLLQTFETGVRYQAWHTLAMLGVLAWRSACPLAGQHRVLGLWMLGILLFSGSLYALALSGVSRLGIITPFGGVFMIAGWLALAWCVMRTQSSLSGRT
ncbi:DUF423 domain-containing protein [Halomonas halocynthiae]|uniref:DUF423 domain-containing protein n=1 Tax=Halomonas halocynthiae TaxID=176290 RepID=UPI00040D4E50|nr:DUF423 domain-containing protein [Halomonas halocynthiae]